MPVPVAFPLASFLARAGITALGTGAATEGIKSLQNQGVVNPNMAQQALMRTIMGPTSEIFNRTTDTPSGKVFAPTGEVIEPNQIPGIAPPEQQQGITGLPIPEQQQGITGLPIPEKAPGLPGLINPEQVDTSILNKEETTENVSTQDLTVENIQNKIKYKKSKFDKNITEAYLGDKKIAEIEKDTDSKKTGNQFDYTINWTNEKGEIDYDDYDRETGFNSAKYTTALGLINTIKSQEKEYLNKFIKAVENKDYDTLNKIREEERGYDFEDSEFRSKEFKDTLIKYIPKQVDLYRNNAILEQEAIKETLNKPGSSVENLTEDQSVNLKGLVSRSVGQEKGMKAIREIYNDDNFLDILNPDQQKYINNLEYSYVGGVGDLGNPIIPHIFDNPMLEQNQEYMQDYQQKLANLLEKNLGKKFPVYRLMDKKTALAIVTGDLPDIKTLQEDPETGESVLKEYTFEGPFGKQTIPQEFMGFSLSPKEALAFRDFSFSGARGKKDEDFVLMEYTTIPTNAVMRGHEGEKEIVFRTVDSPLSSFELYDIKFTKEEDKRDVQLKKNKDFENLKKRFNK
jgi:hypothetical protein